MNTRAGTITPARVFVIGAGVAGLQAIATAKRLGAVVQAYDVRAAVKEQVESLGGRFVHMDLEAGDSEQSGGYAKEMDEEFYRRQRELMTRVVAENDVVITTAAIPGRQAPILVTAEMVTGMQPGSVIVDLAAERGGNCESTVAGENVSAHGVTILGPVNLPASIPYHASEMLSKNATTFLLNLVSDGAIQLDTEDEIVRETLVTRGGEVVHPRIRDLLGLAPIDDGVAEADNSQAAEPTALNSLDKPIPLVGDEEAAQNENAASKTEENGKTEETGDSTNPSLEAGTSETETGE
jgi:NAD(P) transhydrogenase subunit alpha